VSVNSLAILDVAAHELEYGALLDQLIKSRICREHPHGHAILEEER